MSVRRVCLATAAAVLVSACGSGAARTAAVPSGHNVLSRVELQAARERNLLEAIQRLRPAFLRSRAVRTTRTPVPEPVHVYVNGARAEGLDVLKLFSPQSVVEVRFYEPNDANVRFGLGHNGGLIAVTLPQ